MIRLLLLIVSVPLLFVGGEGLYHATRSQQQAVMTCEQFGRDRPRVAWVRLTNCDIDYIGAGYRESDGRITELLFPVRPTGQPRNIPAIAIVATSDPTALDIAQRAMAGAQQPDQEAFLVMMLKIVTALKAARDVDGYVRVGLLERLNARRIVSGLAGPIDPAFVVIDLHDRPSMLVPALEAAGGALALILFVLLQVRRRRGDRPAPATDAIADLGGPVVEAAALAATAVPAVPPATEAQRRLRGLMLLNLPSDAGVEFIENAPPLGNRADVLGQLAASLPGIRADENGRCTCTGPDYSVSISLGSREPIATAVVDAQGDGAAAAIGSILRNTGWRAFAPRRGTFVDPDRLHEITEPAP